MEYDFLPNIDNGDVKTIVDDTLPGVHTPETVATVKILGVDMVQGKAPTEIVDIDLNFAPTDDNNVDPPLVDTPPPVNNAPVVTKISTDGGVRRSTWVCTQPKPQYIPAHGGNKYSYATTAISRKMQDDVDYSCIPGVDISFMQQLSLKAALREWGTMQR